MRVLASAAAGVLLALAGCGSDGGGSSGRSAGGACSAGAECAAGLVCFKGACATSYAAAPSCPAPPGSQILVAGDPVVLPEPPAGTCVTAAQDPSPAAPPVSPGDPIPVGAFVDLGEHAVGETLTVNLPAGTSSLTIVSQDVGNSTTHDIVFQGFRIPNTVVPTGVLLPGGALFYSDTAPFPKDEGGYDDVTGVLAYYGGFTAITGSFTIPNTSAALDLVRSGGQVPPGTWTLTVNDWAQECLAIRGCQGGSSTGTYRIHAYAHPGPLASTGTLDLEVYLATDPTGPIGNATAAVAHPDLRRWVSKLSEHFARAGICVGTVTFRDIPDWARALYAPLGQVDISGAGPQGSPPANQTPSGCDNLSQLFTVATVPNRAVHLFLADDLVDRTAIGGPLTVLGIDGSIPGPSGVPGTVNGGAIIGTFGLLGAERVTGACRSASGGAFSCGTDVLAYVAAHEAGHWLGLYHTTEALGTTFDPLSDTGRCPCVQCVPKFERAFCAERGAPNPTLVDAQSCTGSSSPLAEIAGRALRGAGCSGARNLMFWVFDRSLAVGELSPQQGEVMRQNPAVR